MTSPTTYTSTNSRPCPDCGLKICPERCGSLGLINSIEGEIRPGLNYTLVEWDRTAHQAEVRARSYLRMTTLPETTVPITDVAADRRDYVTMTGLMDTISNGPQSHAEPRKRRGWGMTLSVGAVFFGGTLAVAGLVFNSQIVAVVWSALTGQSM